MTILDGVELKKTDSQLEKNTKNRKFSSKMFCLYRKKCLSRTTAILNIFYSLFSSFYDSKQVKLFKHRLIVTTTS